MAGDDLLLYMYVCFASAVYIPELWPTHLRLRGSGFVNAVGRIVAVFTPYGVAALLTHYGSITVFMVLGVMLVLCALVLSILASKRGRCRWKRFLR